MTQESFARIACTAAVIALLLPVAAAEAGRRKSASAPNQDQPPAQTSPLTTSECRRLGGETVTERRCAAGKLCTIILADGTSRTACIDELE